MVVFEFWQQVDLHQQIDCVQQQQVDYAHFLHLSLLKTNLMKMQLKNYLLHAALILALQTAFGLVLQFQLQILQLHQSHHLSILAIH